MRILFFTDLHIGYAWLDRAKAFLNFLNQTLKEQQVDCCVFLGDVFEQKDHVSNECKKALVDFLKNQTIPFYWLVANHDYRQEGTTTIEFLENLIKEPTVEEIGDVSILFIPYGKLPSEIEEVDIVCFHDAIKGLKLPSGFTFTSGIDWNLLSKAKAKWYFSGHIHYPIQIKPTFLYLGSPIERDFRDGVRELTTPIRRGVYVLETTNMDLTFIEFKSLRFVHLQIEASALERTISYLRENYIDQGYPVSLWLESDETLPEFDKSIFSSCLVSLKIEDTDIMTPKQLDLEKTIKQFIPSKYRREKDFLHFGKEVFKEVGLDLCI